MGRLAEADYRAALGFLYEAGEVDGDDAFPEPLRGALASLVQADTVWHWTVHGGHKELRWGWGEGAPDGRLPAEIVSDVPGVDWDAEDPMPPVPPFVNRAFRRSDLVSWCEWRRTSIWARVDRPLGAQDWVRVWIASSGDVVARFEFDNCRAEWAERGRAVVDLLTPHIGQLLRRASERAAFAADGSGLTPRELEILSLVAHGRTNGELAQILWISPNTVRKHLENVFEKLGVHTRTAAVARVFGPTPTL